MAEIFFTGKEHDKVGIPFLVNDKMELITVPNRWFRYLALVRGRTQSDKTWSTYGYHSLYYFDWLDKNNLEWNHVIEKDIARYRSYLECANGPGKVIEVNSIHDYISTNVRFYKWAFREGFISKLPFTLNKQQATISGDQGFFAHAYKSPVFIDVADVVPSKIRKEAPYISKEQQKILIEKVLDSEEDKLIYALLISTGTRLAEFVGINLDDIPEEDLLSKRKTYEFQVIGKGNKERTVYIGRPLLVALLNWRDYDRSIKIKRLKKKNIKSFWLNSRGGPLTRKALWNRVRNWGRKAGFRLTPHMFRHTFAFRYYAKTKDIYALKRLLGHVRISSTEIYTHLDPETILKTVAELDKEIMRMFKNKFKWT